MKKESSWKNYNNKQIKELMQLSVQYKRFLDVGKTERECVAESVRAAEAAGYRNLQDVLLTGEKVKPGDRLYAVCMKKAVALFQIGRDNPEKGMNILCAHLDSPRLDVKQNPLYEDGGMAYLDTHYYGGIKKYQWVTIPLAIHGIVVKKDGSTVEFALGEKEDDPVFCVTDLLIHLSQKQVEKKGAEVVEGENLDVLTGSRPLTEKKKIKSRAEVEENAEEKEKTSGVKGAILKLLKEQYGIEEEDFLSAELEVIPAGKARDCGLDRSMIMAYGQDDRVCAYTSLQAMLDTAAGEKTLCCLLVDKEEIGSVGATGMQSRFFENTVAELLAAMGHGSDLALRRTMACSRMLSSDVSAGFDPLYAAAFEKKNAAMMGCGMVLNKFTGARGKSGSNDANAEYLADLRRIFDENDVKFQTAELGRVDLGGGGTIAYISALYGMEVIDSGVAVLCMHAPMEITNKADVYEAYKAYCAFLLNA